MESHSTETVEATGPSPLSGRTSQCQLLPGQMERLQAQITAYRYLSRNMAVPPEILARSGPPEPISFSNDTTSDDYENDLDIITPSNSNNNLNYDDNNNNSSNTITDTSFVDTQIRRSGAPSRRRTRFQDPGAASLVGNYMPDHSSKCISYAPVPGRHVIDDANTYFSKLRNERVRAKVHYRVEELLSVLPQLPAASPTRQRAENEMKAFRLLDFQKRIRYQISQGTTSIFLMDSAFDTDSFAPAMPFAASGDVRVCYEPELPTLRPSTLREQGYRVFLNAVLDRSARMCQERRRKAAARAKVCSAVLTVSQSEDSNESINDAYLRISNVVTKKNNNNNTFIGNGMEMVDGIGSVSGGVDGYGDDDGYDDETGGEDIVAQEIAVNLQPFQLVGIRWLHRMYARGLSCAIGDDKSLIAMSYVSCFVANMARLGAGLRFLVVTEAAAINEWLHYLTHFASNVATVVYDGAPAVRREVYRRYVAQGSAAAARESAAIITTPALGFGELALDPWTVAIVDEGFSAGLRGSIFDQATATPLPNTRSKVMFLRYAWPTPGDEVKLFHFVCNKIISSQTSSSSSSSSSSSTSSSSSSSSSLGSNEHNKNESGEMVTENTNKIQEEGNVITICDDNDNENENNTVTNETNNNNEVVVNETNIIELINKHFVLRRDINDVRGLISDRFYTVIRCKMSSIQQIMYRDVCEEAYNNIETKRALEEGREPPKPRQHIFNVQAGDALLTQLQTICTHPFVLVDQYGFDDNIIRSSGKFDALDQILSKVGAFSNIHRFAIYTRKRKIAQILASYLKLREIDYLELRDPAELAGELDPSDPAGAEIHGIQGVIDTWNSQDEKARCVLISTIDTEGLPLVRTDTAVFLDPDWVPKVSTAMAFPMLGYDNTNPGNPYFSLKIFHLVTAYSVEENMLITASNTANWNAEAQAMADPVTFDKLCDNKTKQSILEAYLFKCSSIKYLENNQKELPLAVPGPLFNYAIARNSDELLLFNQIDQSTPADAFPRLLTDDGGAEEGAVGEPGMVGVEEDGSGGGGGMVMDPNAQAILSGASRKVVPRRVTSSVFGNNTTTSNSNGQMPGGRFVEEEEEDLEMKEEVNGEEYLSKLTHLTLNNLCPGLPYNINADRSAICEATPKDLEELNTILAQKQHIQEQTQLRSIQQQQQQQQQGIQMQALGQMGMHSSPRKSPRKSKHDRHSKKDAKSKKDRDRHRSSSSSSSSTGGITNVILNANGGSYIASGLITGETIPGGSGGDKDQMVVKQIAQSEFLQKQQAQQTQQAQAQQQQQQQQQGGIQMMQQDQQGAYIPQLILPQTQAPVHSASPQPQHSPQPQQMGGLIDPTAVPMGAGDPGMLVQGLGSNGVGSGGGVVVPPPPPPPPAGAGAGGEGGAVVPATAADGGVVRGGEEDEVVVDAGEDEEVVEDLASGSVVVPSISPHLIMPKDKTDEDNEKETMLNNKCREIIDSIKSITESQGTLMCMPLLSQVSKGLGEEYSQSPGSLDEVFARTYSTHEAFGFDMAILFSNATNYYQDQPNVVRNIDFLYRFFRDQYKSAFNANLAMPPQKDGEYAIFESEYKRLQKQLFNYELNPNYDEIIYDYADSSKFGSMLQNGGGPGGSGSGELGFNGSGSSDEDDYDEDEDEDDSSSSESGESSSARSDSDSSSSDSGESDRARRKRRARDISEASIQKKRHKKSSKSSSSSSSSSRRSGSKRSSMYAADGAGTVVLSSGMAQGIPTMGVIPSALTQDAVQGMGMQYPEKRSKSRHKHGHSHSHGRSHGRHHHHHHHRHHRSGEDSGVGFHSGLMMATPMIGNEKKKHNRK